MLPASTDVLIVGAGPTGLALALRLQKAGVPHLIVDKLARGLNTSRAAVIHAHTLEALDGLDVADAMIARGIKVPSFTIRDRKKPLLQIGFSRLPSRYPFLLMLPQDITEAVLLDELLRVGGMVHRGISATSFEQKDGKAIATLLVDGRPQRVEACYIVGADGMHSVVRKATGIEFQGDAYEESFILADVAMDWSVGRDEVSLFFSPEGLVVVAPLPDGNFRIVATLDNAPEKPDVADVQALLDTRGPSTGRNVVRDVVWSSRFRVHHRLAAAYRAGNMFVMGDAAHVHSPAGGQGMNAGLVDASVLGKLLADVVLGRKPESALDSYQALRRGAASEVLRLAGGLTQVATMQGRAKLFMRNMLLSVLNMLPAAKRRIAMKLSGLARASQAHVPGWPVTDHGSAPRAVETAYRHAA